MMSTFAQIFQILTW